MLSWLFAVLVVAPIGGAVLRAASPSIRRARVRAAFGWLAVLSWVIALVAALGLFAVSGEAIVGGWSPVSVMGAPLVIASAPYIAALIVSLACVELARAAYGTREGHALVLLHALTFGALALAALGYNFITLFIGMGLADMFGAMDAALSARDQDDGRAVRDVFAGAIFQVVSLLMLAVAVALNVAASNSTYFPLATLSERSLPFFGAAVALRFAALPFYPGAVLGRAGLVAGLVLMMRLAQLGATVVNPATLTLAMLAAVIALGRGATAPSNTSRASGVVAGALLLSLTVALNVPPSPAGIALVAAGWALGSALIEHPARAARLFGALSLFGVPLTIGFVARAGAAGNLAANGLVLGLIAWALGMAGLAYGLARIVRGDVGDRGWFERSARSWASWLVVAGPVLAFGILPPLAGDALPDLAAKQGVIGWALMALCLAVGVVAFVTEPRWARLARPVRDRLDAFFGMRWLTGVLEGGLERLGGPFRGVFELLESNGALVWAIILVLVVVLVARPGGP